MSHLHVDYDPPDNPDSGQNSPIEPVTSHYSYRIDGKALIPTSLPPSPPPSVSEPLSHHFSIESQGFDGAALKKLATPDAASVVIPLGAGRPSPDLYPWRSPSSDAGVFLRGSGTSTLASAFDYGYATGSPQLVQFLSEHVRMVHDPPYAGWATCVSSGSTSALEIALRVFCNRGDAILAEQYTYPGFLEASSLLGLEVLAVEMDAQGIRPDSLRALLEAWDVGDPRLRKGKKKRPSVLYMIPSGHNPTGTTQGPQRKSDIYAVAEDFDLVIVEDDPYYFLRLDADQQQQEQQPDVIAASPYSASTVPSYLSLDKSGRTIRLDSMSKVMAPGLRIGWVTAHQTVIEKFAAYHEICTAFPSGPAQLLLSGLLCETWGHAEFAVWLQRLSARYRARRDAMLAACEKYLPKDACSWGVPSCGMFVWVRVEVGLSDGGISDRDGRAAAVEDNVLGRALENGVQITSGSLFRPHSSGFSLSSRQHQSGEAAFFRLTYAAADAVTLAKGVQLFADAVRAELPHT